MGSMSYQIGVMQGRLLPKYRGRYQAHPLGYWEKEFPIAAELGIDLIEFILDFNDFIENPLMNDQGLRTIQALSGQTGVTVRTVCADYFMEAPLHSPSDITAKESLEVLIKLVHNASILQILDVVVPCVDQSSLLAEDAWSRFVLNIRPALMVAEDVGVGICLETDLPPEPFKALIDELDSSAIRVNYDTGNSAALGYDPQEEFSMYGDLITDVHIKDRTRGGGSVELGTGDTEFDKFFASLASVDYKGPFIMQAYRDDEGIEVFKRQLTWFKRRLDQWVQEKGRSTGGDR